MTKQINQRDAEHYIATRQEFKASALTGSTYSLGAGRLNGEEDYRFYSSVNAMDYIVYSYGTPIAWHTAQGWYIVSQKFSVTTSKHQNAVRRAISSELVGAN
jgi:hypothetical protein